MMMERRPQGFKHRRTAFGEEEPAHSHRMTRGTTAGDDLPDSPIRFTTDGGRHIRRTPDRRIRSSGLRARAWAMSTRSNGSRCGLGSRPARSASSTVIASSSKPWPAMLPATSSAHRLSLRQLADAVLGGNLPSRCRTYEDGVGVIFDRAAGDSRQRMLPANHQRRAWVSSSIRTTSHLPTPSTLPPEADRKNCRQQRFAPSWRRIAACLVACS